ncbi:hypothetical protein HPB47_015504 [Ixodes persulcatus]|uniref:Uncharacterized protein n=1 Tax=Ixodes persulcatus TaxID=34615 RepID=A0AC60QTB3_IXOPE|nr:hypothetical protein HPB47_015504 [Ixodes persulcatus]
MLCHCHHPHDNDCAVAAIEDEEDYEEDEILAKSAIRPPTIEAKATALTRTPRRTREASACYGELGCLNMSGFYDSKLRNVNALPASRKSIGTRFLLYTRRNPTQPDTLLWNSDPDSLRDTYFDPERLTKFYIHGFMQVGKFPDYPIARMRDELLEVGDFNVIAVDWSKASLFDYVHASANTRIVGLEVASLIEKLRVTFGVAPESMHVYGHSLGSHIAGYAGEKLQGRLGRITGLDPGEPFFQGMPTYVRLDEGDALYVEAVHTDGSRFALTFDGKLMPRFF